MSLTPGERWTPEPREQTEQRCSTEETLSLSRQQRKQQSQCLVGTALPPSDRTMLDVRRMESWQLGVSDSNSGRGTYDIADHEPEHVCHGNSKLMDCLWMGGRVLEPEPI